MLLQQTRKLVKFGAGELVGGFVQQLEENPPLLNTAKRFITHHLITTADDFRCLQARVNLHSSFHRESVLHFHP
jgi:hypothetical protein